MSHRIPRLEIVSWLAVLSVAWAALALTAYKSRDPDSALHTAIETDQLSRPARAWIAPEWAGHWNSHGLYREHPVGTFVPPVLLATLGYPAAEAGYAINAVYQVLCLLLIAHLAARFVSMREAHALVWLLQLIPIAFTYRVRANHEQAVLFFLVLALYGTERSRRQPAWCAATVAGVVGMVLVKGLFAVLVPPSCAAWLIATRAWSRRRREALPACGTAPQPDPASWTSDGWAWAGIALSVAAAGLVATSYEFAYRDVTGESFIAEYLRRQLGVASAQARSGAWIVVQKLQNLWFYVVRVLWFAFPWSIVLVLLPWFGRRIGPLTEKAEDRSARRQAAGALLGAIAVTGVWVAAFSLSDRRADRFVFPAYYLVGGAGAIAAQRVWPAFRRAAAAVEGIGWAASPLLWLVLFLAQLVSPHLGLPYVNR